MADTSSNRTKEHAMTTLPGTILEPAYILGGGLAATGAQRAFTWGEVVQAGEFTTWGIRGARSLVRLADGTILQVARTKLPKEDQAKLAGSSRTPVHTIYITPVDA